MTYKELHPNKAGINVGQILDLFTSVRPDRPLIIKSVLEGILEDAYAQGVEDGVELMRDPAYSQESV